MKQVFLLLAILQIFHFAEPMEILRRLLNPSKKGICFAWGGSNFKTFDGVLYNVDVECTYTLLKCRDVHISVKNTANQDLVKKSEFHLAVRIDVFGANYFLNKIDGRPVVIYKEETYEIPAKFEGLEVKLEGYYVAAYIGSDGIKLTWDSEQLIEVDVPNELSGETEGLCGTYDDNTYNDFMKPDGSIADKITEFVETWIDNTIESCNKKAKEHVCSTKTSDDEAYNFCTQFFLNPVFRKCNLVVNPFDFFHTCVCDYNNKNLDSWSTPCSTYTVYSEECENKNFEDSANWRNNNLCPIECGENEEYKTCQPKEILNCNGSSSVTTGDFCQEGCYCKQGFLLHNGKCISDINCPCYKNGKEFEPGESYQEECNTCTCENKNFKCTNKNCEAVCNTIGDPHYTTFDGKKFDFMGDCQYYLVYHEDFSIIGINAPCGNGKVTCTSGIIIKVNNDEIILNGINIEINNKQINKLPHKAEFGDIRKLSSTSTSVELKYGVKVLWDGGFTADIHLPYVFYNKTSGLCGKYNGDQTDDFLNPDDVLEENPILFGNSWKVEGCDDIPDIPIPHPCEDAPENKPDAEQYCSKIKSDIFAECHSILDPEDFYNECLYDSCACNTKMSKCSCPLINNYAKKCADAGILIEWSSKIPGCEVNCPYSQIDQTCGNPCATSCYDIAFYPNCRATCVSGCNCPKGRTQDENGICIPINKCQCWYGDKEYPPGYAEIREGITEPELCTCENARWNCKPATPEETEENENENDLHEKCAAIENSVFTPCASEVPLTCQNMHNMEITIPENCKPGCKCNIGYVYDDKKGTCVLPTQCPCYESEKSYEEGAVIRRDCNDCECVNGDWKCSEKVCLSECSLTGHGHIQTFDKVFYDFQGKCEYVFARGKLEKEGEIIMDFEISIKLVKCGNGKVSCLESLLIGASAKDVIEGIRLEVGKEVVIKESNKLLIVRNEDVFVVVEIADLGLVVMWDRRNRLYVSASADWQNLIQGLCGNYNGESEDDWTDPSGELLETPEEFGDSWYTQPNCDATTICQDTCQTPEQKQAAEEKCSVITSEIFASCNEKVPPENYIKNCIFDFCSSNDKTEEKTLCTSIAAYAEECNNAGNSIKWRNPDLCPLQCQDVCWEYNPCVSLCTLQNCDNLDVSSSCDLGTCIEGCSPKPCQGGKTFWDATTFTCTEKSSCPKT